MSTTVLRIRNLRLKRSSNFHLKLPKISVKAGCITALSGANGSGKTTLLEMVAGLILPDGGEIAVAGLDPFRQPVAAKSRIGFIPDDDGWMIAELSARELFQLLASIYKKAGVEGDIYDRSLSLSKELLFDSLDIRVGELSHGNRKKVQIISATIHHPGLLVVDELRNGLDPVVIKRAENILTSAKARGAAILVATHDLWWAERLADEVVIIKNGRIAQQGLVADVKGRAASLEARFMELYGV